MKDESEGVKRESDEAVGCKIGREREEPGEYGRRVSKMAVTQICQGVGFEAVKQSSLEALSQLVVQYISNLAKSATYNANLAGRSQSNVFDILKGLQDLLGHNRNNFDVHQMSEFLQVMEIPFAHPIPQFPVKESASTRWKFQTPSFLQIGENKQQQQQHIPDWLPAFPDAHTYINSPLWNQRKLDLRIDKGEQARQRRKAERSLLNLQQRLLSNAPTDNKSIPNLNGGAHVMVKHMFAPAIEALTGGGAAAAAAAATTADPDNADAMEIDRRVTPVRVSRWPVVHFKMKASKKMLVHDLDVYLRSKLIHKRTTFPGRDDDKDDKKRRAQFILRQSLIDNQQEVSQM